MKYFNKVVAVVFLLFVNFINVYSNEYLNKFFGEQKYIVKEIFIGNKQMLFAGTCKNFSKQIYDKAIIYEIQNNDDFIPHITFTENKISTVNSILFSSYIKGKKFYGWKIVITEKNGYIDTDYYAENGKNVADGISIYWDNANKEFKQSEFDTSQL